jgi:hypothetical protein
MMNAWAKQARRLPAAIRWKSRQRRRWAAGVRVGLVFVAACSLLPPTMATAQPVPAGRESPWMQLRADDLRLAQLVEHLAVANVALCDRQMPAIGLVLHALDQYPPDQRMAARDALGFPTPLAVEAVLPGSAAALAGMQPGDGVLAIGGWLAPDDPLAPRADSRRRDTALDRIEAASPTAPLTIAVLRGGQRIQATLVPRPACRVRPELVADSGSIARADDHLLQIGVALLDRFDDDGLLVVVAHELAHVMLHHGDRLAAAGVHRGVLGEFGRSARLAREAEDEADRFSVRLLANAGYDSQLAVRFWQGAGRALDAGLLRDSAHASPARRADNIAAEIARLRSARAAPAIP